MYYLNMNSFVILAALLWQFSLANRTVCSVYSEILSTNLHLCDSILFLFGGQNMSSSYWVQETLENCFTSSLPHTRMIFSVDNKTILNFQELYFNKRTRCPHYFSYADDINQTLFLFESENKDWDKHFLARRHVIFTRSSFVEVEILFKREIINTLAHLIVLIQNDDNQIQIVTNKPFDLHSDNPIIPIKHETTDQRTLESTYFPDKLKDFKQFQMKVITFNFPPRTIVVNDKEKNVTKMGGIEIELVNTIAETLNIDISYNRPSDGNLWGWEQPNGSWTGLMGDLQTRKAHMGIADIYVMEPYFKIIDMSISYDAEYMCFVNPVPGPLPQWLALMLPFDFSLWIALILSISLGMIAMVNLAKLGNKIKLYESYWFASTSNNMLQFYACVVNASWIRVPRSSYLRIVMSITSLSFVCLGIAYKASLFSYITIPISQPPINTAKEIYESNIIVGSIGLTLKSVMKENANPWVRKLAETYQPETETNVGFEKTLAGGYSFLESKGFLAYSIAVNYMNKYGEPELHITQEYVSPFGVGVAYPKYASYIPKFNRIIRTLTESGFTQKWLSDIILDAKRSRQLKNSVSDTSITAENPDGVKPLSLSNLQGGFIVLFIGFGLSVCALLMEVVLPRILTKISYKTRPAQDN